ncbi:sin3 histone deacetylase corepressor complex component SDS3-like isoform X2 [Babylonia areolata]|uniref:sin3 histone deacetylase corepressor complex component SDS3-like isoform X2 n=1 Tax=Babylonia areolata TaxID=304850 RepID=UPI003FD17201
MSSYTSSPRHLNEYDFDNEDNGPDSGSEFEDDREFDGNHNVSDEDTEDASETEEKTQSGNRTEIKEQMYQDKLSQLKKQLQMLQDGTLSDFVKRSKKIHQQYLERQRQNEAWRDLELELAVQECEKEKKDADREFHDKKIELKEVLLSEWHEKKMNIETERQSMDLANGDMFDVKPIMTRKLRRRPNDPLPLPAEKRRKTSPATIIQTLAEKDINDDLEVIQKTRPLSKKPQPSSAMPMIETSVDVRIEYGKLLYDKRWFHRGTHVIVESKDTGKVFGHIYGIGNQEIWIRRNSDSGKLRIYVSQLQKGKYTLQRRTS